MLTELNKKKCSALDKKVQLDDMDAEELKAFLIDGEHGEWDGWQPHEKLVIQDFIEDIKRGMLHI